MSPCTLQQSVDSSSVTQLPGHWEILRQCCKLYRAAPSTEIPRILHNNNKTGYYALEAVFLYLERNCTKYLVIVYFIFISQFLLEFCAGNQQKCSLEYVEATWNYQCFLYWRWLK